jgi:predicted deacylase
VRTTQLATAAALAALAVSALIGLGAEVPANAITVHAPRAGETTTTNEVGGSRDVSGDFIEAGQVHATLLVGKRRALVAGPASRVGKRIPVHEEHDDAGQHITVDGFHRRLTDDLTLTWRSRTVPLDCANAFHYDLQVTKEDTTGD